MRHHDPGEGSDKREGEQNDQEATHNARTLRDARLQCQVTVTIDLFCEGVIWSNVTAEGGKE